MLVAGSDYTKNVDYVTWNFINATVPYMHSDECMYISSESFGTDDFE